MIDGGFTRKKLEATITLGTGDFGETVGDTVTLSGLRMMADIVLSGGDSMGQLQMRVYGLTQDMMNRLTVIGRDLAALRGKNYISLRAGDDTNGMSLVYQGSITDAWVDYPAAPEGVFNVMASAGMDAALKPVTPISFNSASADVSGIMAGLAKTMGLAFQDLGVSVKLSYPYFDGTALMQARSCARAADIWMTIDKNTLIIWPKENAKIIGDIPLVSPETGLIGYPSFSSVSVMFTTIFNQDIRQSGKVQLQSSIPAATGRFRVFKVSHSLSSEIANGPWFTYAECGPDDQ